MHGMKIGSNLFSGRRSRTLGGAAVALALLIAPAAQAAPAAPADPAATTAGTGSVQGPSGFRFSAPRSSIGLRAGFTFNRASSDVYDFIIEQLTVERGDFNAPTFALDYAWSVGARTDLVLGVEYGRASKNSEFRDYVDQDDIPIVQDTRLTQVPLTLSVRFYLTPRGRSVGQYAWVPSSVNVYVGGGGGATWFRLEQAGEFVDFRDLAIFEDVFVSDGWAISGHALGGIEVRLSPSINLVVEGRYQFASHDLRGGFVGFDPIDLNGMRLMAGVSFKI